MNSRFGWSQPPAGWGQPQLPGWAPLVDAGTAPLYAARSVGRWLFPIVSVTCFLVVTGFMVGHDDPTPGLSRRGLLTIALAAVVVVLLTMRRAAGPGPLARALFEYAVVFVLAVLVATTGIPVDRPTAADRPASATSDRRPALVKTLDGLRDWLSEWRDWAHKEINRRARAESAALDQDLALVPSPAPLSSPRRWP